MTDRAALEARISSLELEIQYLEAWRTLWGLDPPPAAITAAEYDRLID